MDSFRVGDDEVPYAFKHLPLYVASLAFLDFEHAQQKEAEFDEEFKNKLVDQLINDLSLNIKIIAESERICPIWKKDSKAENNPNTLRTQELRLQRRLELYQVCIRVP